MRHRTPVKLLVVVAALLLAFTGLAQAAPVQQQPRLAVPLLVVNTSVLNIRTGPGVEFTILTTVVGGTELPVLGTAGDSVWYQVATQAGAGWVNIEFTLPRGDFSRVPLVRVDRTNVPFETIDPAALSGGVAPATQSTMVVVGAGARIYRAIVTTPTNVYTQPSISAPSVGTVFVQNDQDYAIVGSANVAGVEWLAVVVPDLGSGWVEASKISVRLGRTTARDVLFVNVDVVALTSGPGGSGSGLPVLTRGIEAYLVNITPDGQFVQVELGDGTVGWLPFFAVATRTGTFTDNNPVPVGSVVVGAAGVAPTAGVTAPQPRLAVPRIVVNTSFLNARSGPGAQYTIVTTLRGGTELPVVGIAPDRVWFLVEGSFGRAWVNNEFVVFRGAIANVPTVTLAAGDIQVAAPIIIVSTPTALYPVPGVQFGRSGTLNIGEYTVTARSGDFQWIQVSTPSGFGWVLASQVILRGDTATTPIVNFQ